MQQMTQDYLANKAKELLNSGICSRVFGWKRGEFDYDLTPAVFTTAEQIDREFVYNGFCAANFSKYLVNETRRDAGKVAVFLKPCDSYSFNQLLTEHRFDREKVYAVGIPCEGMTDINKVRQAGVGAVKVLQSSPLTKTEILSLKLFTTEQQNSTETSVCLNAAFTANPNAALLMMSFSGRMVKFLTIPALMRSKNLKQ